MDFDLTGEKNHLPPANGWGDTPGTNLGPSPLLPSFQPARRNPFCGSVSPVSFLASLPALPIVAAFSLFLLPVWFCFVSVSPLFGGGGRLRLWVDALVIR